MPPLAAHTCSARLAGGGWLSTRDTEHGLRAQPGNRCRKSVAMFRCPRRIQCLPQVIQESADGTGTRLKRLGSLRQLVAATMKHHLPVPLTSRLTNRWVIEHAIRPAQRVIGIMHL